MPKKKAKTKVEIPPMIDGRPKTMEEMTREEMEVNGYPLDVIDDIHPE